MSDLWRWKKRRKYSKRSPTSRNPRRTKASKCCNLFKLWSESSWKQIPCLNHSFDCWWVPVVNHKCEYNLYKSTAHLHVVSFPFLFHSFSFSTGSTTPPILRGCQSLRSRSFAMAQVTQCSTGRSHARTLSEYSIHQNHCGPYGVVEPIFGGGRKVAENLCGKKTWDIKCQTRLNLGIYKTA